MSQCPDLARKEHVNILLLHYLVVFVWGGSCEWLSFGSVLRLRVKCQRECGRRCFERVRRSPVCDFKGIRGEMNLVWSTTASAPIFLAHLNMFGFCCQSDQVGVLGSGE